MLPPGDIWQPLETSLLVISGRGGGGYFLASVGKAGGAAKRPTAHGTTPPQRITRPQISVVLWLKPFSSLSHLDEIITLHRSKMWWSLLPAHTQAHFGVIWPMLSTLLSALPHATPMQHKSLTSIYQHILLPINLSLRFGQNCSHT